MRESIARRAALGTGVVVLVAASLFAVQRQRDAMQTDPAGISPPPDIATSLDEEAIPPADSADVMAALAAQDTILALGERVYAENQCAACHSIAGVGNPRSPLDGVGARLTGDRIRLWIVDPQAAQPGVRKPAFDDLPAAELDALVAFMQSLR